MDERTKYDPPITQNETVKKEKLPPRYPRCSPHFVKDKRLKTQHPTKHAQIVAALVKRTVLK